MIRIPSAIRELWTEIPPAHAAEFNRLILFRNLTRVRVICWTMLVALVPYGIADYFTLTGTDSASDLETAMTLLYVRIGIVAFTIFYLFRIGTLPSPESLKKRHRGADILLVTVYMTYMAFTLGFMFSFRTDLSVYLLFILVASAFLVWTNQQSFVVMGVAFFSLTISLPLFGAPFDAYKYKLITVGVMTGITYVLAQLTRINQIQDFLNKKTIEQQNLELMAERTEADNARQAAIKANQAKSDFLASMSHEIRTPMNAILGMTEVTLESELTDEQHMQLTIAQESATQLLAIINDILDFSKIEAGKMSLEQTDFDLHELLNSIFLSFLPQAKAKGLPLSLTIDGNIQVTCKGDPVRLRQVVSNLLSNALKFTVEGAVNIRCSPAPIQADDTTTSIRISVTDTGIGVPEDKKDAIFDRFNQVDDSTTRHYGGTGLGLAISRNLAALMGGTLTYAPNPAGGSIFTLTIPLPLAADQTSQAALSTGTTESTQLRILVADDNQDNRHVIKVQLERLGHSCVIVDSGSKVLDMLPKQAFDIVILDLEMPEMDGMTTTRTIRQGGPDGEWPQHARNIPILALTAHAVEDMRTKALAAGMNEFLTKPVLLSTLRETLHPYTKDTQL